MFRILAGQFFHQNRRPSLVNFSYWIGFCVKPATATPRSMGYVIVSLALASDYPGRTFPIRSNKIDVVWSAFINIQNIL